MLCSIKNGKSGDTLPGRGQSEEVKGIRVERHENCGVRLLLKNFQGCKFEPGNNFIGRIRFLE